MVEYFYYIKKTKPTLSAVESLEASRVIKYFGKLLFVSISFIKSESRQLNEHSSDYDTALLFHLLNLNEEYSTDCEAGSIKNRQEIN